MKHILILLSAVFILVACSDDDDKKEDDGITEIRPEEGQYRTPCVVDGPSVSFLLQLTIAGNDYELTNVIYDTTTDCTGPSDSIINDRGTATFSNVDLGGGVSYFLAGRSGAIESSYISFMYNKANKNLYIGNSVDESDWSDNPEDDFADFIADPEGEAEITFEKN